MKYNMIYLKNKNNYIGLNGKLLYKIPKDLQHFKETTINNTIIMGMKTFLEIGRGLPKRLTIVVCDFSRGNLPTHLEGVHFAETLEEALELHYISKYSNKTPFLVGGAKLYNEAMEDNKFEIEYIFETVVDDESIGDAKLNFNIGEEYEIVSEVKNVFDKDEVSGNYVKFDFITYKK